jgi:rod shape-determining protein MreD
LQLIQIADRKLQIPMRWTVFFILAYLGLGVQLGMAGAGDIFGARVNVVLLAAIFVALNAPREEALLGCFMLGLGQDMLTLQPLGLWAMAYTLVGMTVISTQEIVYREQVLTHVSLGLGGGLLSGAVLLVHGWVYPLLHRHEPWSAPAVKPIVMSAILTALAAPIVLGALQRGRKLLVYRHVRARAHSEPEG